MQDATTSELRGCSVTTGDEDPGPMYYSESLIRAHFDSGIEHMLESTTYVYQ